MDVDDVVSWRNVRKQSLTLCIKENKQKNPPKYVTWFKEQKILKRTFKTNNFVRGTGR